MENKPIKTVKFSQDFSKLDLPEFGTLRKGNSKFTKNRIYRIKSPNHDYLAKCTHATATYLNKVCDEFLMKDTDTNSRKEAIDLLKSFYPDLTEESVVMGVFFEKVIMKMKPGNQKRDGIIQVDQRFAKEIGFTSDLFERHSYLWIKGKEIYISFIQSKTPRKGHFTTLVNSIIQNGYIIKVPSPIQGMESVVQKLGFTKTTEYFKEANEYIDVWIKGVK